MYIRMSGLVRGEELTMPAVDLPTLRVLRVHCFLQIHAQLFPDRLELFYVLVVLALVLYFGFDACDRIPS